MGKHCTVRKYPPKVPYSSTPLSIVRVADEGYQVITPAGHHEGDAFSLKGGGVLRLIRRQGWCACDGQPREDHWYAEKDR